MSKTMRAIMDREETAISILDDLLDELDSAGAVLAAYPNCRMGNANCSGAFSMFAVQVGRSVRRAKQRLTP